MEASSEVAYPANALPAGSRWRTALAAALAETAPLWVVLVIYAAAAVWVARHFDLPLTAYLADYCTLLLGFTVIGGGLGLLVLLFRIAIVDREKNPTRRMKQELRALFTPEHAATALLLLLAVAVMQDFYAFFKPVIPRFVPYSWDPVLAAADRALFFGQEPWRLLWPLLGNPVATWTISTLYNLWFFWMLLVWVLVAFATRHRAERLRYFLAVLLAWIVGGTVMATIFSSVGPCYYGYFNFGSDPYAAQIAGLFDLNRTLPVYALAVQDILWHGQQDPTPGMLAGISAFPSMHVTAAVLRTRIAFVYDRTWGIVSAAATVLIFVGSIHLAWHYAMDGIVGTGVALAAWWAAGRIMAAWSRRRAPAVAA